jgi:hypothetical protein
MMTVSEQVNNWKMFKVGQVGLMQNKVKKYESTVVLTDYEHDNRNHQDNPTLVRTQDPSPPDNTLSNNVLNQFQVD